VRRRWSSLASREPRVAYAQVLRAAGGVAQEWSGLFGRSWQRREPLRVDARGPASTQLATAIRMQLDRLEKPLKHLGVGASNYKVLKLLPLVYVAWASGKLTPERERRLVDLAHNHFSIGVEGERILRGWLKTRPDKEYIAEGLHEIVLLAYAPDEWEFDVDELPGLLAHSEAIARTTAAAMDVPTSVTDSEERALAEIARELGIDNGESWAALVHELDAAN